MQVFQNERAAASRKNLNILFRISFCMIFVMSKISGRPFFNYLALPIMMQKHIDRMIH